MKYGFRVFWNHREGRHQINGRLKGPVSQCIVRVRFDTVSWWLFSPDCIRNWTIRYDETVLGADNPFNRGTLQECLDYCAGDPNCFGVDVDYNLIPLQCWPHSSPDDYVDHHIFGQIGTNSYQLITRCPLTTTIAGLWTWVFINSNTMQCLASTCLPKTETFWNKKIKHNSDKFQKNVNKIYLVLVLIVAYLLA